MQEMRSNESLCTKDKIAFARGYSSTQCFLGSVTFVVETRLRDKFRGKTFVTSATPKLYSNLFLSSIDLIKVN